MTPRGRLIQLRPEPTELTDAGMVAACAAGDRGARAQLFERHVGAIHRFVARMRASDADTVDDLVQVTFVRAFAAAARFRGPSARSWLYGIAANVVREHARRAIRRKRAHAVVATAQRASVAPAELAAVHLPALIAALPHELRAVFVLVDLEGERGADAAAALGIPEGTLWRRVFEARQILRRALGRQPVRCPPAWRLAAAASGEDADAAAHAEAACTARRCSPISARWWRSRGASPCPRSAHRRATSSPPR